MFIPKLGHNSPIFVTIWKIQTLLDAEFSFTYMRQIILYYVPYKIHLSSNWEPLFVSPNWLRAPSLSPGDCNRWASKTLLFSAHITVDIDHIKNITKYRPYLLYAFFWVIPRCLKFICRCFGTHCLFHLHRQVGVCRILHMPTCLWRWNRQSVLKRRHINFRRQEITQKKAYTDRVFRNVGI
jgi:hypothetical protein